MYELLSSLQQSKELLSTICADILARINLKYKEKDA
jgi:hypothetical protein